MTNYLIWWCLWHKINVINGKYAASLGIGDFHFSIGWLKMLVHS